MITSFVTAMTIALINKHFQKKHKKHSTFIPQNPIVELCLLIDAEDLMETSPVDEGVLVAINVHPIATRARLQAKLL